MSPLQSLAEFAPPWATNLNVAADYLQFDATLQRASGAHTRTYSLIATCLAGMVRVREDIVPGLLPSDCPQRHINSNGTFCIGLRAGHVGDPASARTWWQQLSVFLWGQETAHSEGIWPPANQLSHGNDAADTELKAEELARKLGLVSELEAAIRFDSGVIAELASAVSSLTGRPSGGSAPCACGYKTADGRLKRRRQCFKANDKCLVGLEAKRRAQERQFWESEGNKKCCETMRFCPRRNKADASTPSVPS
jgi:hypothetical protein